MKHFIITLIFGLSINAGANISPFAPAQSERNRTNEHFYAISITEMNNCMGELFEDRSLPGIAFEHCTHRTLNRAENEEVHQMLVADISEINRCFNNNVSTGADYMQILADCRNKHSYTPPRPELIEEYSTEI